VDPLKIALIGAGSRSFGPATVRDVLLSDALAACGVRLALMDADPERLPEIEAYARQVASMRGQGATVEATAELERALDGADFVVKAIDFRRFYYWAQDWHVPRKYGFKQVFGENGGPGSLFHALRNMGPTVRIARAMERLCPGAPLLSYTNPEHKLCEAVCRLTSVQAVGLCHGVFMGLHQIARMLEMPVEDIDADACGINHFSWFQHIRDRRTGEDLYPRLRAAERAADPLSDWHEIGMGRILFRRFGLWPSPGTNHYGEYVRWADEFYCSELQFYNDPADGYPWEGGAQPEWLYSLSSHPTDRPLRRSEPSASRLEDAPLVPSGELAVPIMESLACGVARRMEAVNVPNRGAIPNLPDDMVVEVPADADRAGLRPVAMQPLPEAIAAMLRLQGSIHQLLVEAYAEGSKEKLLQAVLLEPTVDSYRRAVEFVEEMLRLQADVLPAFG
jgi:alpha-galactosidase